MLDKQFESRLPRWFRYEHDEVLRSRLPLRIAVVLRELDAENINYRIYMNALEEITIDAFDIKEHLKDMLMNAGFGLYYLPKSDEFFYFSWLDCG